jgi:hypothetical protein
MTGKKRVRQMNIFLVKARESSLGYEGAIARGSAEALGSCRLCGHEQGLSFLICELGRAISGQRG